MSHQEIETLTGGSVTVLDRQECRVDFAPVTEDVFDDWPDLARQPDESYPAETSQPEIATPVQVGEIAFEGTLRVNGYVAGIIKSDTGTLIVEAGGEVDADIQVYHAIIDGCVRGDIRAQEKVELGGSARVIGDIETATLSIQPGAVFEGRCIFFHAPGHSDPTETTAEGAYLTRASSA